MTLRQPIITIVGHVDHGKTSLLDSLRGTSFQKEEAGGITQKISLTRYPLEQIEKISNLIEKNNIKLEIPGFLFIDTPGHAAFVNIRKRGGSLADLAVLVVDIKEGIKPQTAEVISILRANKTPFVIALNKIDSLSGWKKHSSLKESINSQAINVTQEFESDLLTFQGSLQSHGFNSALFYEISDFTKEIAIVPCSAKTKEGIPELVFVLVGLCQKFLKKQLRLSGDAKGIILEIKKEKSIDNIEAILYDGILEEGDRIVIATLDAPIESKVRAIEEIQPLSNKYKSIKEARAATGLRLRLTNKSGLLPGMPFQKVSGKKDIAKELKKEVSSITKTDKQGIVIKADSLGSLEALITLLHQANIRIVRAGIGPISKTDIIAAKANLEINPLDAVAAGFNVPIEEIEFGKVKVLTEEVIYRLIENIQVWRADKQKEIEREKLLELATICKMQILPQFVFRNSNPAIFGVKIIAGRLKTRLPIIDQNDNSIAHVKGIQSDKHSVEESSEGAEVAISLPGVTFDRQLKDVQYLYTNMSESQFKAFKKHKELINAGELKALQEIAQIKQKKNPNWGV